MSDKEKIYELLQRNRLTSKEVSEQLNLDEGIVRTNISRLLKENKIRKLNEKSDRYCLYTSIVEKEQKEDSIYRQKLKELYDFMGENMTFKNDVSESDITFLTKIKELI